MGDTAQQLRVLDPRPYFFRKTVECVTHTRLVTFKELAAQAYAAGNAAMLLMHPMVDSWDVCTTTMDYTNFYVLCALIATMLILLAAYTAWHIWGHITSPIGNDLASKYLSYLMARTKQPKTMDTCTTRSQFMKTPNIANKAAPNHTHPGSAAVRNAGASFMDLFSAITGLHAYFIQSSPADARNGRDGCRTFHWGKDLSVKHQSYAPKPADIRCIVDVDMYLDMPNLLATSPGVFLLTTFQPSRVCHSTGEYSFTFDSDDRVLYNVSGGACYTHHVWDYGSDVVTATTRRWWFMFDTTVYNVDRRKTDEHHQLILLTPIRRILSPFLNISRWLGHKAIERLSVNEEIAGKNFLRLNVATANGLHRSTGIAGNYHAAYTTAAEDDTLAGMARIGKTDLSAAGIKTAVDGVDQASAIVLTEYHRLKTGREPQTVYPVEASVFRYQFSPKDYDPEAKASLIPFMSPIILGCYSPDKTRSNDAAAVSGRITSVAPPEIEITPHLLTYMQEFAAFLIPNEQKHKLHPVDIDTVKEKQNRPAQQAILLNAENIARPVVDEGIQTFQKSEAYSSANDPRIISTLPGVNKLNYSRYIYAFTTLLRATKWYAFAKTPIEIATRVAEICVAAMKWIINTDLSRFDGRVSTVLRTLETILLMRAFHTDHHKELNELIASQKNQRAKTTFGVKYDTGLARLSGSPETADMNSVDNAFMGYLELRTTPGPDGLIRSPQEAWDALGIYGGDDGITADVDPVHYSATCRKVGQVLDAEEVQRGKQGVKFLAREYGPGVWHGDANSMCDVPRQLSKLHTTISLPPTVTAQQKLGEKLYSFFLTDANTPIIGTIATWFTVNFKKYVPSKLNEGNMRGVANYNSLVESDVQYPNTDQEWMQSVVDRDLPQFDHAKLREWMARAVEDETLLLSPPLCLEDTIKHEAKADVVVNGEVISAPKAKLAKSPIKPSNPKEKAQYTPEQLARMAATPCKEHANGKCKFSKCRFKH